MFSWIDVISLQEEVTWSEIDSYSDIQVGSPEKNTFPGSVHG